MPRSYLHCTDKALSLAVADTRKLGYISRPMGLQKVVDNQISTGYCVPL